MDNQIFKHRKQCYIYKYCVLLLIYVYNKSGYQLYHAY